MINHISITDFAIIKNTEIDFDDGLNIITGETGSGKSIVVEAISLALGSRADSAFVRHGSSKATIQLAGQLGEDEVVITREISATGKNLCKLNGQLITLGQLSDLCKKLADIHGQYDNQSLLNTENHISIVDRYRKADILPIFNTFSQLYQQYADAKNKLNKLVSMENENAKKLDFYKFQIQEIDNANLKENEDMDLENNISILQNSEKIFDGLETAYGLLNEGEDPAISKLGTGLQALQGISQYSTEISQLHDEFATLYYGFDDISTSLRNLIEKTTFSPDELDESISRLDLIESLKKKYGGSIGNVIEFRNKISEELDQIENFDDTKKALETEVDTLFHSLTKQAGLLTSARKISAMALEKSIEKELYELNFRDAKLKINFSCPEHIGPNGNDIVEIMISTNKGEPEKPLVKIASGGEISRIMLAIKNITGTYDAIPTMIFDEIDAGISGITASIVADKLKEIARNHQIICITHLPQIAAAGDQNYKIYKESDEESTYTYVELLSSNGKIDEIARLLGGNKITETTKASAKELIDEKNQVT